MAHSRTPEERELLKDALRAFLEEDLEGSFVDEDLAHPGLDTLYGLRLRLTGARQCRMAIDRIARGLGTDASTIADEAPQRLDARQNLMFKLDKSALLEGRAALAGGGDSVQVRINLAAFPKTREAAVTLTERLFGGQA